MASAAGAGKLGAGCHVTDHTQFSKDGFSVVSTSRAPSDIHHRAERE